MVLPAAASESFAAENPDGATERVITLAIVESNHALRESFRALAEQTPELRCIAAYSHVTAALSALPDLQPEVMLFDAQLLANNGTGLIARLKASCPTTQILILTTFDFGGRTFESACEGASGDLPKTTPAAELVQAIKWVHAGGSLMSMPLARRVTARLEAQETRAGQAHALTGLERQVIAARARGTPYPVIAGQHGLGVAAVLSLLRGVYEKLGDRPRVT